jgi:hypothetical protein
MESDVSAVFLNQRELAEMLSYRTENGSVRRVAYTECSRTQTTDDQSHHQLLFEVVDVFVSNSVTSGMPDPKLGDAVQFDGDQTWFDFVSRMYCEGGFEVKWRKRLPIKSGIRPAQL